MARMFLEWPWGVLGGESWVHRQGTSDHKCWLSYSRTSTTCSVWWPDVTGKDCRRQTASWSLQYRQKGKHKSDKILLNVRVYEVLIDGSLGWGSRLRIWHYRNVSTFCQNWWKDSYARNQVVYAEQVTLEKLEGISDVSEKCMKHFSVELGTIWMIWFKVTKWLWWAARHCMYL